MRSFFPFVATAFMLLSSNAPASTLVVDPTAAPGGNGSPAQPFRTIEQARDAIRKLRADEQYPPGGIAILMRGGDYPIDSTITFNAADGGAVDEPIAYRAAPGERPRLIGGVVLENFRFEPVSDEKVLAQLPDPAARAYVRRVDLAAAFGPEILDRIAGPVHRGMGAPVVPVATEVFLDGRPLTLARWPNADTEGGGFARVTEVIDPGSVPRNRADDIPIEQRETGEPRGGIIRFDDDRLQRWAAAEDAWLFGYWHWDWADEQLPIESIDAETKQIKLGLPHRYGLRKNTPFYIRNLLEELDAPGEFYIDRARGVLYLWPFHEGSVRLEISTLADPIISIEGASHLRFIGLDIACTRGGAIRAEGVDRLFVVGCDIRNTGTFGVSITGRRSGVISNDLSAIGGTAISIAGGDRATLTPGENQVLNNHVCDFGRIYRTYQPAIRLAGVGQSVANNRLHDAPHSAIIFYGNDHRIERNEIYDVLKETGDCGAIYCGRDWTLQGNVIRFNLFHHLRGVEGRWQNAVYLDDMASGIHVVSNVFYDCHWAMLVGGGRDVSIRGNVFVKGSLGVRFDARGVGWMASHIADPSTSTIHKNLAAVPYDRPPWSDRFPRLRDYLTEGFGRPMGSEVVGNAAYAVRFASIEDREAVRIEGNVEESELPSFMSETNRGMIRFHVDELTIDGIDGFEQIPVARIGIYKDGLRFERESSK